MYSEILSPRIDLDYMHFLTEVARVKCSTHASAAIPDEFGGLFVRIIEKYWFLSNFNFYD
jgi:hypothetical protein